MTKYYWGTLFLLAACTIHAQNVLIQAGPLSDAIEFIQKQTKWIVNYNVTNISKIYLKDTIHLELDSKENAISRLLASTAVEYNIEDDVIILLPTYKKKYKVCGHIRDKHIGQTLPFAHVYIDDIHGGWSEHNGYFEFYKLAYKNEKVKVSYLGYQDKDISISKFSTGCINVELEVDAHIFSEEITIRDYILASITKGQSYDHTYIRYDDLNSEMGSVENDVLKTIQFLPGITSLDESASNLSIRGNDIDQNLIVWEDAPMYNTGHLFGMISSINPFLIDNIKVYKGSYSAAYENRIGGIIDISLPHTISKKTQVGFGSTFTEAHLEASIPLINNKLSLVIGGRNATTPIIESTPTLGNYSDKAFEAIEVVENEEGENDPSDTDLNINYADLNAKIIFQPNEKSKFSSSLFTSKNSFLHGYEYSQNTITGYDSLTTSNTILSNVLSYTWNEKSQSYVRVNFSNYNNDYLFELDESQGLNAQFLRSNENSISDFQAKFIHHLALDKSNFEFGYVLDKKEVEYHISEIAQYEENIEGEEEEAATFHHLYFNADKNISGWHLDVGMRTTFLQAPSSIRFAPRFSLSRSLLKHFTFKMSSGIFHQYVKQIQNFSQSALNLENKIWVMGNEDVMKSSKVSTGFTYQKGNLLIDVAGYTYSSSAVPVITSGQSSTLEIDENGSLSSRGIEALIKKRWGTWTTALSYHLGFTKFNIPDFIDESFPGNNDQRHNLSFINHYKLKNWSFGFHYHFRSGLPYSQPSGIELIMDQEEDDYYEIEVNGLNEQNLQSFHRTDLILGYKTRAFDKINMHFQVSMFNIFDFSRPTSRNYILSNTDISTEEPEIFEVEKSQLRRTPQILLRITL